MYPYAQNPGSLETLGLKKDLEMLMEENRELRDRIVALESQKVEDPHFSTPDEGSKEADRPLKEADRPAKEADRPPRGGGWTPQGG